MPDVTFAQTRHTYDSYTDYWRLVELSGFPIVYVDEMNLQDPLATYIVSPMNGEFEAHLDWSKGKNCVIYHWNLERPGGSGDLKQYISSNKRHIEEGKVDAVVVSDKQLAKDTGFHYVPLGGHEDLGTPGTGAKPFDFIHLMCYSYRRASTGLFNYITPHTTFNGFRIAPNGWGEKRHNALQASRFMLNIHQDDSKYIEPLRFVLAACYGLPIITEEVTDPYPYARHVTQFSLSEWEEVMKRALRDFHTNTDGQWMRARMTRELTFRKGLEAFL